MKLSSNFERAFALVVAIIGILAVLLLPGLSNAFAQEYFAKGDLEVVIKSSMGDPGERHLYVFLVEVVEKRYKLRIEEDKSPNIYYEYAYEDGLMHILHHTVSRKLNTSRLNSYYAAQTNVFPARIEVREIPPNDGTFVQYLWFAMASHSFFANLTNNLMVPIWSPEDPAIRKQPFEMLCFPQPQSQFPHLPAKVIFYNDGYYRSYNPASKALDVVKLPAPFEKGFTNAIYQVLSLTNAGDVTLPERFVFTVYSTPLNHGSVPFERVLVSGVVSEVGRTVPEKATLSPFQGVASVADYRLGRSNSLAKYVPYQVTNNSWLDSNQLAKVKAHNDQVLLAAKTGKHSRFFALCFLVGTSLILATLVIRTLGKNNKAQQ